MVDSLPIFTYYHDDDQHHHCCVRVCVCVYVCTIHNCETTRAHHFVAASVYRCWNFSIVKSLNLLTGLQLFLSLYPPFFLRNRCHCRRILLFYSASFFTSIQKIRNRAHAYAIPSLYICDACIKNSSFIVVECCIGVSRVPITSTH